MTPTIASRAKRWMLAILLAAAPAALAACGGGEAYVWDPSGTLVVENDFDSWEGIEQVVVTDPWGDSDVFDVWLAPGDWTDFELLPDDYDVELVWSDGWVDEFWGVPVFEDEETVVTGLN
jgi:hypothetical protein